MAGGPVWGCAGLGDRPAAFRRYVRLLCWVSYPHRFSFLDMGALDLSPLSRVSLIIHPKTVFTSLGGMS